MSRLFSGKTCGAAEWVPLCRRSRATHSNAAAIGHNRSICFSSMRITNRAVLRDFNNWVPFVKIGGVVAFHDVGEDYEGPKRVVAEKLRHPSFAPVQQVERLAWAVKRQSN